MTAQASVRELLARGVPFDAVYAGDDDSAAGALAAIHEGGLRVPEDISVVGFDDQRSSAYTTPPLTTVRAPTEQVGRVAAGQLLNLLRGSPADPLTLLPTELVIRRSCGCHWWPG
jgi:DNA-binding LacI/PurR family transcriptional regulator